MNRLKLIFLVSILAVVNLGVHAQSSPVDKVAELDDVYSYYMPAFMIKGMVNMGGMDILKATPIPTGMLKKVTSMQFIMASKKKVVKKAQKILKDLDDAKNTQCYSAQAQTKRRK